VLELFHTIADTDSAAARRLVVELGLKEQVSFRNVAYDEARADLEARGGSATPALWDGHTLVVGAPAIARRLALLKEPPHGEKAR